MTPTDLLENAIRTIPDFPEPGIQFRDITPILGDAKLFELAIDQIISPYSTGDVDQVVGIDARGFIFGAAAALRLQAGFTPIRKKGKLPFKTYEASYDLEYGSNTIAIHTDAIQDGSKVLLVDDLLATGGTAAAALSLLKRLNADILESVFLIELDALKGRARLGAVPVRTLISY